MAKVRETFGAEELAISLSHYDIGIISKIEEFARGSRRAPKLIVESQRGKYLFKRRAKGKDDLAKVAFTHQIQLSLASQNFPLPHLVGTRDDNNSMLVLDSYVYELFEYIQGTPYDQSLEATQDAGKILALMHKLLLKEVAKVEAIEHQVAQQIVPQTLEEVELLESKFNEEVV